jgi:hypothetical protein
MRDDLQKLVEALDGGAIEARPASLTQGSPLKVESLDAVMRVVMFEDPGTFKLWARRCSRLSRVFRFFRMHSWAHMADQAALHFEERERRATVRFRRA